MVWYFILVARVRPVSPRTAVSIAGMRLGTLPHTFEGRRFWRWILVQGTQYNYFHGVDGKRDGVGIVMCEQLEYRQLTVERKCDRLTRLELDQVGEVWTLVSCFTPQTGCTDQEKFCDKIDSMYRGVR